MFDVTWHKVGGLWSVSSWSFKEAVHNSTDWSWLPDMKATKATPKAFFEAAAVHCRCNALWGEIKAQIA